MQAVSKPGFQLFPVRTWSALTPSERRLLRLAAPLVIAVRTALWVMPLRRVRRALQACESLPVTVPPDLPVSRLVWAVRAVSKRIPAASCLTQALALQFLLHRAGKASEVHIGIAKGAEIGLQSHAWVECEGQTLLSAASEITAYSRVLVLPQRGEG